MSMEQSPWNNQVNKELASAELSGLCFELLNNTIPKWFSVAQKYENALKTARHEELDKKDLNPTDLNPRVDSTYVSTDYKFEGITSFRLRLVPQALREPYKDEILGEVKELIINIPEPFVAELEAVDNFQLAILTVSNAGEINDNTTEQSYILTSDDIMTLDDFDSLDLSFTLSQQAPEGLAGDTPQIGITNCDDIFSNEEVATEKAYDTLLAKRNIANSIFSVISEYRLGNQSRNDGTM